MKKWIIASFIPLGAILINSCAREDCERYETGTMCLTNETSSEVTVWIDGSGGVTLETGEQYCREVSASVVHTYHAEENAVLGDVWDEDNATVIQCQENNFDLIK